uniref:Uncharacterized protein n=1 Tax=Acrobeloides nanus TaxID=290746 RepID=A0A914CTH6_9BILA
MSPKFFDAFSSSLLIVLSYVVEKAKERVETYVRSSQAQHKLLYDRKINVRVRRNRHKLSYDRTTQYDGIV